MAKMDANVGLYPDDTLSHSKLLDVSAARSKVNVTYWNRFERLHQYLEKNMDNNITGADVVKKLQEIEREFPIT